MLRPVPAVVVTSAVSLLLSMATAWDDWDHIRWRDMAVVSVAGVAGMPLGVWVLAQVPERVLTVIIAVVLLAPTAIVSFGERWRGADFSNAFMHASSIQLTALNGANFTDAPLGSVIIINSNFEGADFGGAIFPRAVWINVTCPDGTVQSTPRAN